MACKIILFAALLAAAESGFVSTQTGYYADPYATTPPPILLQQQADLIRAHQQQQQQQQLQQLHRQLYANRNPYQALSKYDPRAVNGYLPPAYAYSANAPAYSHRYPASALAHRYAAPTNAQAYLQQQQNYQRIYTTTPPPQYRQSYYQNQLYRNPHPYAY